jgi:polyferredoxin
LTEPATSWKCRLWQGLVLAACAVVPAAVCQTLAPTPQDRRIHVESFRYGKEPSVIRCHRGDRLHLTFWTRDTAHSFFLQEFDLDVKITPGSHRVAVFSASNPSAPPRFQREVVFKAEHPGLWGYLVSKSQYRCHVWCGPMHAFEHGNLIIEPNTLLYAGLGLVVGIPVAGLIGLGSRRRRGPAAGSPHGVMVGRDLFRQMPWLKRLLKGRHFQFACVAVTMGLLYVVLLTTLFGTKMSGRNLGVMLTWVVWLFLLCAVLTPFGGRIWCFACPLPLLGEILQRGAITGVRVAGQRRQDAPAPADVSPTGGRGLFKWLRRLKRLMNKWLSWLKRLMKWCARQLTSTAGTNNRFFGLNRPWPKWLANDWPRIGAFLVLGTFSSALVANPKITGWLILGLVVVVIVMALVWRLRAFCRYLCPVNAFVGLYAKSGKLALRAANPAVCDKCQLRFCQKGSEKGWPCPYGLCVAEIKENNDCGLCTECIKTCPYDNVTLRWRPFAEETTLRSAGEAWLSMTMLVLAAAYCLVHLGHWPSLRDYVNILDKGNWDLFAVYASVLWTAALVALPGMMLLLAAVGKRLARAPQTAWSLMTASAGGLVPIGLLLWIAFVVPMLMVNATFVLQSVSDPFGWGWDFLGTANTPWRQIWPQAIPWIQVACILAGLHYSLRNTWRIWLGHLGDPRRALRGVLPMGAMLVGLAGWFLWFFAN